MNEIIAGSSYEPRRGKTRNEAILEAIEEGRVPMMPFEKLQLEIELLGHVATQDELSALYGEAMNTTSETWHDNAQAEVVTMQSKILKKQGTDVAVALRNRFVVPYDQDEQDKVSIGAVVEVEIGGLAEKMFITGRQRSLTGQVTEIVGEDTTPVSIQSPIGKAIFDQSEGAASSYQVGAREFEVHVVSIEYPDFSSLED